MKKKGLLSYLGENDVLSVAVIVVLIIITALLSMFFFTSADSNMEIKERFEALDQGWEIEAGALKETVDLPVKVDVGPDEQIILRRKLPDAIPAYTAIVSRNYHMKMVVSVDNYPIYYFPNSYNSFSDVVIPDDWNMAEIAEDMGGRTLEIRFTPDNLGFKGYLRSVYLGEDNAIIQYLKEDNSLQFAMGLSILIAGVVLFLVGTIYRRYYRDYSQAFAGLMLLITGIWLTNRAKMPVLGMGSGITFFSCFVALSVVPTAILLYCGEKYHDKFIHVTRALQRFSIVFVIIIIVFSLTTGYSLDRLVAVSYFMMAGAMLYTMYLIWCHIYGKERENRNRREIFLDKIEFGVSLFMIIMFVIETIYMRDELWTEVNIINRIGFNVYAAGHIVILIMNGYYGVKDRQVAMSQLKESQIKLMTGQIQPHFLFNALSSIRTLIKEDPDKAYNKMYDFAKYLRANVDSIGNTEGIGFNEEIDIIKNYVNIEELRYGNRLRMGFDTEYVDFMVPALSIQPLVENAIKHGIAPRPEGGTILVKSYFDDEYDIVEVVDNGVGISAERFKQVFSITKDELEGEDISSVETYSFLERMYDHAVLREENGLQIDLGKPKVGKDAEIPVNGHKPTGFRNTCLRLREMTDAIIDLESQINHGTRVVVKIPRVLDGEES